MRRDVVTLERRGVGDRLAEIVLPGGMMGDRVARELVAAIEEVREDRTARVVVVRARGEDFCTGPGPDLDRFGLPLDPASALATLRMPVVAVIAGACRSVGFEVVLAADIRVAGPRARFALDDLDRGQIPCWGGTQRLARSIRPAEAAAMLLLAEDLEARRALDLGAIHILDDDPVMAAEATAERLLGLGPLALELAKEAVHRGAELPLRDGLRLEGDLNHLLASTDDRAEGLQAFFDKRPPDFAGR